MKRIVSGVIVAVLFSFIPVVLARSTTACRRVGTATVCVTREPGKPDVTTRCRTVGKQLVCETQ